MEELTMEVDRQLSLGFEIIPNAIKIVMPKFDLQQLNKVAAAEAIRRAQDNGTNKGKETLKDPDQPVVAFKTPVVSSQDAQVVKGGDDSAPERMQALEWTPAPKGATAQPDLP